MNRNKHYKNMYVDCKYEDQIERSIKTRGTECTTLTDAKALAREHGGYAIRVYVSNDSSDIIAIQVFW